LFQTELNPPAIQITYPDHDINTEEASVLPESLEQPTERKSLNPFLRINETNEEVGGEELGGGELMLVDDSVSLPVQGTNPFRRSIDGREGRIAQDEEMES
jgi:hypothetical protein